MCGAFRPPGKTILMLRICSFLSSPEMVVIILLDLGPFLKHRGCIFFWHRLRGFARFLILASPSCCQARLSTLCHAALPGTAKGWCILTSQQLVQHGPRVRVAAARKPNVSGSAARPRRARHASTAHNGDVFCSRMPASITSWSECRWGMLGLVLLLCRVSLKRT